MLAGRRHAVPVTAWAAVHFGPLHCSGICSEDDVIAACPTDGSRMQVVRDKAVIKPAKGKRQCNCKNKLVTRQVCGPTKSSPQCCMAGAAGWALTGAAEWA